MPPDSRLGRGGPVTVETKAWRTPVLDGFMKAGYQLGFSQVDPSDPDQVGECVGIYRAEPTLGSYGHDVPASMQYNSPTPFIFLKSTFCFYRYTLLHVLRIHVPGGLQSVIHTHIEHAP